MKRTAIAAVAVALAVLTGCSAGTEGKAVESVPTGSNATPAASDAPMAEEALPTETQTTEPQDETVKFGKSYTWENGVSATISAPKTLSRTGGSGVGGEKFKSAVSFTITIVNKSGKAFEPSVATVSVQSGDLEGDEIFDSAEGFEGSPSTKVLNGRQTKYKVGFGVSNPKDVIVEFSPGFEYNSAIWTK